MSGLFTANKLLAIGALAIVCSTIHLLKFNKNNKNKENLEYNTEIDDINKIDINYVDNLVKTSRTISVFSHRYANYLVEKIGNKVKVDAYYLSVLYNWKLLDDSTIIFASDEYFFISFISNLVINKFGNNHELDIILTIINELASKNVNGIYNCYDSMEEYVIWERLIPYLENKLLHASIEENYDKFEVILPCLFSLYAQCDYKYYTSKSVELKKIMRTEDTDSLSDNDKKLHNVLINNKDNVISILNSISIKYGE